MAASHTPPQKLHILLVEDSRVDAAIVKALLTENNDMDVTSVGTFSAAITALMDKKYDAVVLDLCLPDSSGAESTAALKKKFPEVPVIIFSGNHEEVAILKSLNYGADEFLTKDAADNGMLRKNIFDAVFRKSLRKHA